MGGRFAESKWGQMERGFDGIRLSDVKEYQLHNDPLSMRGVARIFVHTQRPEPLEIMCSVAQLMQYLSAAAQDNELDD